ncbi:MAG: hypothetical protein SGI96_19925 [Bacteroidota bacterium]|nr:hypothetical protein [Chitinophagaceae bacterium]MDZ4810513.1 hypothetical protein [Bacteroidota bacterium]
MFAKIKSSNFIDALKFQLFAPKGNCVRGVLKDDTGSICRTIEKDIDSDREELTWTGLNDLPYGRYTLELSQGNDEPDSYRVKMNLVKRV